MAVLDSFTSVFYETGDNMNLKPNAVREKQVKASQTPAWIKRSGAVLLAVHRLRMLKRGAYSQRPFDFFLYTPASPDKRVTQHVAKPTAVWAGRV